MCRTAVFNLKQVTKGGKKVWIDKVRILDKKPKLGNHDHMLINLEGEIYILLTDPRRFGFVDLIEGNEKNNKFIKNLGQEALSNGFTGEYFYSLVKMASLYGSLFHCQAKFIELSYLKKDFF